MTNSLFKGILTVSSGILTDLMLGNLYTWGNINQYYYSYIRIKNSGIKLNDIYFALPIALFFQNCSPALGGFLDNKIGTRLLLLISLICFVGCNLILYFVDNFPLILFAFGVYGFGNGLIYFAIIRCGWRYFPKKRGLINGIISMCYALAPFIFTWIADSIINPEGDKLVEGTDYYGPKVTNNVPKFIITLTAIIVGLEILAIIILFPYKENKDDSAFQESSTIVDSVILDEEQNVKVALKSKEFFQLGMINFCIFFFGFFLTNTYRSFGAQRGIDENVLQTLSKVFSICNALYRVLFGFLYDKYGFFWPYFVLVLNQVICSGGFYFSGGNSVTYFIVCCLSAATLAGHTSMFPPFTSKKFGLRNSVTMMGFVSIFISFSSLGGPILTKLLVKKLDDYMIIYFVGSGFSLIGFIIFLFVKEQPFDYNQNKKASTNQLYESGME